MRVTIVAWAREFLIEVGCQEPVLEIKAKIELLLGVPVSAQILSILGWELVDGLDMEDYPIVTEGTRIDLTIKPMTPPPFNNHSGKIQITVKFSAKQINIEVDTTDTVRSLKEKIHIVESTPIKRMSLFFSGVELDEDFRNLSEYGIGEFSEIIVFLKTVNRLRDDPPTRKLNIVVKTSSALLNAASIPLEMKDSSTVNDLRSLLLSRKILPEDDYLFIHKQRIMRDNCSLRWHGVENGDSLYVFKGTVSRNGY
ncbi:polyubiquitin 8 [Manihot esculenta]|uniref:Ubiquitin-like domain-containing protein n=1 Tax=Manihot esculenta TaxID=3983 RepID=A0A2C9UPW6_MANES|nr:polyubiquitin 8 [Manihot esculenta]OAY33142.1 hypothetical protein MANES_13G072400v8 [Manihot esculenta]